MIRKITYLVGVILFAITAYLVFEYFSFVNERNRLVEQKGIETTAALRDQVDGILSKIVAEGNRLTDLFGSNEYSVEEIEEIIKESSLSIPEIQGVTACFEPFSFSAEKRLHCPYYNKATSDYMYVEETYDYSVIGEGTGWYTGVRDEGAKWVEPYFATAAQDWYIDYGIPFYYKSGTKKGQVKGTITMSFVASGFKKLVHSLSLGKTGYGLITSTKGTFLSHPINEYIGTKNLAEISEEETRPKLTEAYKGLLAGESGKTEFYDSDQDDQTLFFFDKIPSSGWGIGLLFYKNDLLGGEQELNRMYIRISIFLSLFLVYILGIYYNKDHLDEGEIWNLGLFATALFMANIFLVSYLQHNARNQGNDTDSPPIVDVTSLGNFINGQHERAEKLKIQKAIPVPTGLYIQQLVFEDSYNVNVGGTVWQKYPIGIADSVEIGIKFPQMSPFAEAEYIEETYRETVGAQEDQAGYLLVGSEFRVTLRLNLKYADFPLDKRHINIEILPKNMNDHLIFTPDLASYNYTNPTKKSGLNQKIKISGSEVLETYFNYSSETYDADFGYGEKSLFEEVPVLHFNIHLRRLLFNAFVTYLIPIFVTLIMVFILMYSCEKTAERQGISESMAAFFFVLIFSHIDMRKEIITADVIYMEYFYFISYFMLILTTFNLIVFTKDKSKIFDFNENQIFKASYFPIFFLLILVVTLVNFY